MANNPFVAAIVDGAASAGDFIANILHASTEHSITGKSLGGTALLWNEGVRRPCVHEPSVPPKTGRGCFDRPQRETKCTSKRRTDEC